MINELQLQKSVDKVRNGLAMCACAMDSAIMDETELQDEILFAVKDTLASYVGILADVSYQLGNSGPASRDGENVA